MDNKIEFLNKESIPILFTNEGKIKIAKTKKKELSKASINFIIVDLTK